MGAVVRGGACAGGQWRWVVDLRGLLVMAARECEQKESGDGVGRPV